MSEVQIEKMIKSAVASLEMEGFTIDDKTRDLCRKLLRNEITMEEYTSAVMRNAGVGA